MPFTMVPEDSAYKCTQCGHVLNMKKGQLVPPCPRCGAPMEKSEVAGAGPERAACS